MSRGLRWSQPCNRSVTVQGAAIVEAASRRFVLTNQRESHSNNAAGRRVDRPYPFAFFKILLQQHRHLVGRDVAVDFVVDHHYRGQAAGAEAAGPSSVKTPSLLVSPQVMPSSSMIRWATRSAPFT